MNQPDTPKPNPFASQLAELQWIDYACKLARENAALRSALFELYDEQEDAPTEKRSPQWEAAMRKAADLICPN